MKQFLYSMLSFVLIMPAVHAQKTDKHFFKDIDSVFGLSSVKKIDTSYYTIAEKGWMVNLNNNFAGFLMKSELKNVPLYQSTKMTLHSAFNYQLSTTFGYRNLILGVSLANINGNAEDFTVSLTSNAWGFEFRRLATQDVRGNLSTAAYGDDITVAQGDVKIKTKYLRAYHVFNNKKYSTTAATDGRCTQKKSAGSLLFYTNYSQNTVTLLNNDIIQRFNGIKTIEYSQAELSLGYGYNFTPNRGKVLFNLSLMPMFVVLTSNYIPDTSLKETDTENKYFFNCMGRFTASYRVSDNFGLCFSAFLNTNRFSSADNLKVNMYDYRIKTSLCFRF